MQRKQQNFLTTSLYWLKKLLKDILQERKWSQWEGLRCKNKLLIKKVVCIFIFITIYYYYNYAYYSRRRRWYPTPILLPGKSHGWRSLVGCSPWGRKELDTTERLHFHVSLSRIGEGHGNLLQCSCLENPRDGGAWWAAVYGVVQSQTWLKRLSSSSSSMHIIPNKHLYKTLTGHL